MAKQAMALLIVALLLTACRLNATDQLEFEEANTMLINFVDGALDSGLQGAERPDQPISRSPKPCTDDLIGPTSEVSPTYDYLFEYTLLDDGEGFVERVTEFWEKEGFTINKRDDAEAFRRFATSDDGFSVSVQANQALNQVSIGGSGPCVDPPE